MLDGPEDDEDPSRLKLIPLCNAHSHIIIDSDDCDVINITGQSQPRRLRDGTAYAFTIPVASEDSLDLVHFAVMCTGN